MTDAIYQLGQIDVELVLEGPAPSTHQDRLQMRAAFDRWQPFIHPVFAASDFAEIPMGVIESHGWEDGPQYEWYAKDFCIGPCVGNEQAPGAGTPVYLPFSVQIASVRGGRNEFDGYADTYNLWLFHPYTGFVFQMSHQVPGPVVMDLLRSLGRELPTLDRPYDDPYPFDTEIIAYDPNAIIAYWAASDHPGGPPHLHLEGQISYPLLGLRHRDLHPDSGYIDGDPGVHTGNPRYNNCANYGLENLGPCYTPDGEIAVANISMEVFLLDGWIDPSK
jgi:hypothetical protein